MALSSGQLLGPVIGGVLYEYEGYFQVFLPAFGLLIVEIVLRLLVVEKRRASMTSLGGEAPSTETSEPEYQRDACAQEAGGPDKSMVEPAEPLGVEAQLLLSKAPIARPTNAFLILLACPRFLVAITGLFIMNSIACGFDGVLAPYIHDAFDLKSTHAAALFLAMALPNMFVAPVIGALTDRYGTKLPIAAGCTLAAPTLFLLRFIVPGTSLPFVKLMVVLVFVGMSLACIMPPLGVEASKVVDAIERDQAGVFGPNGPYSQAYGLAYFAVAAGGLVGPLYAGYLRAWLGWEAMSLSMAILSSILFGLVVLFIGEQSGLVQKLSARVEEGEQDR
ncbi:hypothetical protein MMC21_004850 [Puttea exsequens]|nr:hypothetical protein [Puttea exsequens]